MQTIRKATAQDAALITQQRILMFHDNEPPLRGTWQQLETEFLAWVTPRIATGEYVGWIAEEDGKPIGGAGLWVMHFPPHWMDTSDPRRGYLLNFYVVPEARGRGLAKEFVRLCIAECDALGIKTITLHASKFGKPIYEKLGFQQNNEMVLRRE